MEVGARLRAAWAWIRRVEARVDAGIAHAGTWLRDHRPRTRRQWTWAGVGVLLRRAPDAQFPDDAAADARLCVGAHGVAAVRGVAV